MLARVECRLNDVDPDAVLSKKDEPLATMSQRARDRLEVVNRGTVMPPNFEDEPDAVYWKTFDEEHGEILLWKQGVDRP